MDQIQGGSKFFLHIFWKAPRGGSLTTTPSFTHVEKRAKAVVHLPNVTGRGQSRSWTCIASPHLTDAQ